MVLFKKQILLAFALLLTLTACGGGDDDDEGFDDPLTDLQVLPIAQCTALHVNGIARLTERMQDLFNVLNGAPLPAGITKNSPTEYTFELDLERDGTTDITVDVDILDITDISDGMQGGESINLVLTFSGTIIGTGNISFSLHLTSPPLLSLSRSLLLNDVSGTCTHQTSMGISWEPGNLDSVFISSIFIGTKDMSTLNAQIFGDSDFLTVFGQLVVGSLDPVDAGFVIGLDTFEVFDD